MNGQSRTRIALARNTILGAVAVVVAAGAGAAAVQPRLTGTVVVVVTAAILLSAAFYSPSLAFALAVSVGVTVGFSRRLIEYHYGPSPLLNYMVILPALTILLIWTRTLGSNMARRSLPWFFGATVVAIIIGGINPAGVGIVSNFLTSAVLLASILAMYLVVRGEIDPKILLTVVLLVGTLNALYMLGQEFLGMPDWDQYWVDHQGYAALYLGENEVRAFGMASSGAESSALSGMLGVVSLLLVRKTGNWLYLVPFGIGMTAVFIAGTRTFAILALLAVCVSVAINRRHPIRVIIVAITVAAPLLIVLSAQLVGSASLPGVGRILTLFSGKENPETSTIPIHIDQVLRGLRVAFTTLIGTGSGQLGVLASGGLGSAEFDISNLGLMAGIIGIVAGIAAYAFYLSRLGVALTLGGAAATYGLMILSSGGQWFNPGCYGLTPLIWATFGAYMLSTEEAKQNALVRRRERRSSRNLGRPQPVRARVGSGLGRNQQSG